MGEGWGEGLAQNNQKSLLSSLLSWMGEKKILCHVAPLNPHPNPLPKGEGIGKAMRLILISLLSFYKAVISPWLPPSCRFVPTCSEYAREAIQRHGAIKGTGLAIWRLLRCQPFCAGGYDPVK